MSFQKTCAAFLFLSLMPTVGHSSEAWRVLYDRGIQFQKAKKIDSAIISMDAALDSARAKYGLVDSSSAMILHRLGNLKNDMSSDSGLAYWNKALMIWNQIPNANPLEVGKTLNNLGSGYLTLERFDKALDCARRAFEIKVKLVPEDDSSLASPLSNLGFIYTALDSVDQAERSLLRAKAIRTKFYGDTSSTLFTTLTGLGDIYLRTLRYEKAAPCFLQVMRNFQREGDMEAYHGTMANLAHCFSLMKRYGEADSLFDLAVPYLLSDSLTLPRNLLMVMTLAGRHWESTGQFDKATLWLTRAKELCDQKFSTQLGLRSTVDFNLALVKRGLGKYAEATRLLEEAIDAGIRTYGKDNLEVTARRRALAQVYLKQNESSLAVAQLDTCMQSLETFEGPGLFAMSEQDALQTEYLLYMAVDDYLSAYFINGDKTQAPKVAAAVLSTKGQITDMIWKRHQANVELKDSGQAALMEQLINARKRLSRAFAANDTGQSASRRQQAIDSVSMEVESLESKFALHSATFGNSSSTAVISSEKLSSLVPDSTVLVEYYRYSRLGLDSTAPTPQYLALVISKHTELQVVNLGNADSIDTQIEAYRQHMLKLAAGRKMPGQSNRAAYAGIATSLYNSLLQPIESHIRDAKQLLIAPDGPLSYVSFAGLLDGGGIYLTERFRIHYLSAGRDLIRLSSDSTSVNKGLLAIGDPDYNASPAQRWKLQSKSTSDLALEVPNRNQSTRLAFRSACGEIQSLHVDSLPNTRAEVRVVSENWSRLYHEKPSVYLRESATEDLLKDLCHGKRAIHLATHGYYIEDRCADSTGTTGTLDPASTFPNDPMLFSGLLFAGANLHGAGADSAYLDDGFLSAEEVLSLNLKGADLVVLSACETGMGEVRRGEGVFGLKRAFEIAGARTVVSSLWQIPDQSNADIMMAIYSKTGGAMPARIQKYQLEQIRKLRTAGFTDHPFTWAAFIAQGDWR